MKIKAIDAYKILFDARHELMAAGDEHEIGTDAFKLSMAMDSVKAMAGMKRGGKNAILNMADDIVADALSI